MRRTVALAAPALTAAALLGLGAPAEAAVPVPGAPPPVSAGGVLRIHTGAPGGTAALGTLTVTGAERPGYATAFPCDQPRPLASTLNYAGSAPVANFLAVGTDDSGAICVFTTAQAHILFDAVVLTPAITAAAPVRTFDSRAAGAGSAPLAAGEVRRVPTGVPSTTVMANLTVAGPAERGYITAFPCDGAPPLASNAVFPARGTMATFITVGTDAAGEFCVRSTAATHVVVDRLADAGAVAATAPLRRLDTREPSHGAAPVPAGGSIRVATGAADSTVMGTLTTTGSTGAGYLTAYECGTPVPTASNLNHAAGQTIANFAAVRTDSAGEFCVFSAAAGHVVFDQTIATTAVSAQVPSRRRDTRADWSGAGQIITVKVASGTAVNAAIEVWQRGGDGKFARVRGPIAGFVGEEGMGTANSWQAITPAGVFTLTQSFGIMGDPGAKLPYFQVDSWDWWDGDRASPTYNSYVRSPYSPGPGSENLYWIGYAYNYSVVMDYNLARHPDKGSAFFFHVSNGEPTGGCVSAPIGDMRWILRFLDPAQGPVITNGIGGWGTALVARANA